MAQAAVAELPAHQLGLSVAQAKVWTDPHRFRVVSAGRRFGKTHLDVHELARAAQTGYDKVCWFIAPTYRQAKKIAWSKLKELIPDRMVAKIDETDLTIVLKYYRSEISLRGADNPDSLRGPGLDFVCLDEYADMDRRTWPEVIRPALSDKAGEALFTGTPRGFNHFYDLWVEGPAKRPQEWAAFQFTTLEGGNVPQSEVDSAREDLDPRVFRQEYEAAFEALAGRVYYGFERGPNTSFDVRDIGGPLLVGMDFNVDPMTAVLASRAGDELHVHDEIVLPNASTSIMVEALRGYVSEWRRGRARERGDGLAENRTVVVYPDPSGAARKTSAPVGQTDFTILRDAGYSIVARKHAPPIVDRVNEVNALACNSKGRRRLLVHPRCVHLLKALEGLTYRSGTSVIDKSLGLDHVTDALGYLIHEEYPIQRRSETTSTVGLLGI